MASIIDNINGIFFFLRKACYYPTLYTVYIYKIPVFFLFKIQFFSRINMFLISEMNFNIGPT